MSDSDTLVDFILARLDAEPLATRVKMYRALSSFAARTEDRRSFEKLARELEAVDAAHQQLVFDFRNRARGQGGNGGKL